MSFTYKSISILTSITSGPGLFRAVDEDRDFFDMRGRENFFFSGTFDENLSINFQIHEHLAVLHLWLCGLQAEAHSLALHQQALTFWTVRHLFEQKASFHLPIPIF